MHLLPAAAAAPQIRDVIDMRKNKWVPRRETFTAKKLDEVHAQAEAELGMVSSKLASEWREAPEGGGTGGWQETGTGEGEGWFQQVRGGEPFPVSPVFLDGGPCCECRGMMQAWRQQQCCTRSKLTADC